MPTVPFRCQVRLSLSDLDRNVYAQRTVVIAQYPDEPDEHILLRFLSHALWFDEHLSDAQGWTDHHVPDLIGTDLTGEVTQWIECGTPPMKRLVKALGHHKAAQFMAVFADPGEAESFRQAVVGEKPRNLEHLEIVVLPPPFMAWLEGVGMRSMVWQVTITEGTLYLDCDGQAAEVTPQRMALRGPPNHHTAHGHA
jgi:uncharacterized protein YaeQ